MQRESGRELEGGRGGQSSAVTSDHSNRGISKTIDTESDRFRPDWTLSSVARYTDGSLFDNTLTPQWQFVWYTFQSVFKLNSTSVVFSLQAEIPLLWVDNQHTHHNTLTRRHWTAVAFKPSYSLSVSSNQVTRIGAVSHESPHKPTERNCSLNVKPPWLQLYCWPLRRQTITLLLGGMCIWMS